MASGLEALLTQELFIALANPTITTWANPFPQPVVHEIVKVVVVDRHSVFYQTAMLGLVLLILGKLAEKQSRRMVRFGTRMGSSPDRARRAHADRRGVFCTRGLAARQA